MIGRLAQKIIDDYRADPRNKVFIEESVLIAAVAEETGQKITAGRLREVITAWQSGEIADFEREIYDGATYACAYIARQCFSENPEDEDLDVNYEISWVESVSGALVAELRPN
jgi:hypothetical protein